MKRVQSIHATRTALAIALSCLIPLLAHAAQPAPGPTKIADQRSTHLRLNAVSLGQTFEIRTADASFVKVKFDQFSLPDGVTLEVFNPDRSEIHRYNNASREVQTGRGGFSAMSITGPVALVRLVGTPRSAWRTDHGVRINSYLQGYSDRKLRELQIDGRRTGSFGTRAIIGNDDKRAAACYTATDPTAFDRSRPVGFLVLNNGYVCTAWRVGPNNHVFTNNHCISTAAGAAASEVWFNYQLSTCGGAAATPTKVWADKMLKTDAPLDYTLFTLKDTDFAKVSSFGYLGLETRAATLNEEIFIPSHPGGRMKELSVFSDQDGAGRCRVNNTGGTANDMRYYCDTEGGSSGAPVVARASNKVIALHHAASGSGTYNLGVKMSLIWPQVSGFFGGVAPDGDNGGGGSNVAPAANFTSATSGLTATFTDSSTDSDGSIASRLWDFGDGTSSTVANPTKTYAAAGTYNVKLTVTDNGGLSNTRTVAVTVSSSNCGGRVLCSGTAVALPSGTSGAFSQSYTLTVPAGKTSVTFALSGGSGDADMYVNLGSATTTKVTAAVKTSTRCVPWKSGNNETCTFTAPTAGTYYVTVHAYSSYSGVSLKGTISP